MSHSDVRHSVLQQSKKAGCLPNITDTSHMKILLLVKVLFGKVNFYLFFFKINLFIYF